MFRYIDNANVNYLFNLADLSFYKHISYSFVAVSIVFKTIFNSSVIGMTVYSRVLLIIGAYGMWKLLHLIYEGQKEYIYFLFTLGYCVSPYFLGQVSDIYLDSASWYIFPILAYYLYANKWSLAFFCSIYFVFTKETNVISYSFLILGMYVVEAIRNKKLINKIFKYCVLITPSIFWLLSYLFVFHVTNQGEIHFRLSFIAGKIKSLLLLNFNTLFFLMGLLAVALAIFNKSYRKYFEHLFPIFLSMIAFLLSSFVIITGISHPRYIDALVAQLYILSAFVPLVYFNNRHALQIIIGTVQAIILFVSNYYSIDPMMMRFYLTVNVGKVDVCYYKEVLSDAWCMNYQHQNWGYVTDLALAEVAEEENTYIYMPAGRDNSTWFFDAMGKYKSLGDQTEYVLEEYWDINKKTRMVDASRGQRLDIHVINSDYDFSSIKNNTGYYMYTDYEGYDIYNIIKSTTNVIEEKAFEKNGWIIYGIKFIAAK